MRIVAVRHLPTRFNGEGLLQGRRDLPILSPTVEVERAVRKNRARLDAQKAFDKVLVSRLKRTSMTADCYGYQAEKEVEPLLDELDFGPYEGRPRTEMLAALGGRWLDAPQTLTLGESLENLERRVRRLLSKYDGMESVLIFGHGAWIRALISIVESGSIEKMNRIEVANNELCIVRPVCDDQRDAR